MRAGSVVIDGHRVMPADPRAIAVGFEHRAKLHELWILADVQTESAGSPFNGGW
jgi:hypothetical protein